MTEFERGPHNLTPPITLWFGLGRRLMCRMYCPLIQCSWQYDFPYSHWNWLWPFLSPKPPRLLCQEYREHWFFYHHFNWSA